MNAKISNFTHGRFSKANLTVFAVIFAAIGGYFIYSSFAATTCSTTLSSGGNVATALTSVTAGGTVCLNAGTYSYNASVSKSSMTTVTVAADVDKAQITFSTFQTNATQNVTFDNITIAADGDIGTGSGDDPTSSINLRLQNSRITTSGSLCITGGTNNAGIVIDNVNFGNSGAGSSNGTGACGWGEGRLTIRQTCTSCGTVVKNSYFGPFGDADGIQIGWGGRGFTIGPGNVFDRIQQDAGEGPGCPTTHCDSIQPYGTGDLNITGNFFYKVSDALQIGDCGTADVRGTPANFTNNVVTADPASQTPTVDISEAMTGMIVSHNTLDSNSSFILEDGNQNCPNQPITIRDNIFQGSCEFRNMTGTNIINHNLVGSISNPCNAGTGSIVGSPTYVGGTSPTTLAGFALASTSKGHLAASDGTDMGAQISSGTVTPPPPPPSGNKIGDINTDGSVDIFDLSILLSNYNTSTTSCDLNSDNTVNIFDLSILLSNYGT